MNPKIPRRSLITLFVLLLTIILTSTTLAEPTDSVVLLAGKDSYTDLNQPDTNFNGQMLLTESTMGAPGLPDVHTRVLFLGFDLSNVQFEIKSASLSLGTLTCNGLLPLDEAVVDVHGIDYEAANSWTENGLTWNTQPVPTAPPLISAVSGVEGRMYWTDGAGGAFASWLETQRLGNDGSATLLLKVDVTVGGGIRDVFFDDKEESAGKLGCEDSSGPPMLALDSKYTAFQLAIPIVIR